MFLESKIPEVPMYTGKTLFAQIMDFLPWSTFHRTVQKLQRRPSGSLSSLCRAVSNNGLCSTYLSGEPPRYRSLFVGAVCKTLSHGPRGPSQSLDPGRCQRISRLAHLRGLRSKADLLKQESSMPERASESTSPIPHMHWMPRLSISACRCSLGLLFGLPKLP